MNYPYLSGKGKSESGYILNKFVEKLKKTADEAIKTFYVESLPHIESDAWINYRNDILNELCHGKRDCNDWVKIRAKIYEENKNEIQNEIIADLKNKIIELENFIENTRRF